MSESVGSIISKPHLIRKIWTNGKSRNGSLIGRTSSRSVPGYVLAVVGIINPGFEAVLDQVQSIKEEEEVNRDKFSALIRKTLLDIFNVLGSDPRVRPWRTQMARTLN